MTTRTAVDAAAVRRAVEDVPDPELPPVTIGMLGMVHDVRVAGGEVAIELLPTFSGCPATDMIGQDVEAAVRAVDGVETVRVRFRHDPPWTSDRIDAEGREQLRRFGIAPPGGPITGAVMPEGRRSLPVMMTTATEGRRSLPVMMTTATDPRPCPYCGSADTERDAPFGPTPCRDVRYCRACDQPFEAFRS